MTRVTLRLDAGLTIGVARMRHGLSQRDLAARVGISPQYLNDIEQGRRPLHKVELIQRFADVLSISPDPLYYAAGLLPPDVRGDYTAQQIRAAFDAMRAVLK